MPITSTKRWGNGLGVRLTKKVATAAGVSEGTRVRVGVSRGKITIERVDRPMTLKEMLAAYDPERHGGILMDFPQVGREVM